MIMNTINLKLMASCLLPFAMLTGCAEDPIDPEQDKPADIEQPEDPDKEYEPIVLSVDPPTVILEEKDNGQTAATFNWTDENKYETEVTYTLKLNVSGAENGTAYFEENLTAKEKSFSVKELNDILTDSWHREPGKTTTVEATVSAMSSDKELVSSDTEYIDVTPYGEATEYLSMAIFGTASGNEQLKMIQDEEHPEIFRWEGNLDPGTLKILCNPGNEASSSDWFIATEADREIVYGMAMPVVNAPASDGNRNDFGWKIKESGKYSISMDTKQNTITFMMISKFYSSVAMVGPATPNGWAAASAVRLARNGNVFEWQGELNEGTLRFLCDPLEGVSDEAAWEVDQFIATEADKPVISGETENMVLASVSEPDRGDNMWKIEIPGTWKITLDTENMTVIFTLVGNKLEMCPDVSMIGPASPSDWSMSEIVSLTKSGKVWEWSGHLDTGEIQFLCDRTNGGEWGRFRLVPKTENDIVFPDSGTKGFNYMPSAEDWKWNIAVAGEYEISIDSESGTVTFSLIASDAYKAGYENLGLIGSAAPQGWNPADYSASTMTEQDKGIYVWEGRLSEGDLNIFCDTSASDWSSPRLTAWNDNTAVTSGTPCRMRYMENENKWIINEPGTYRVTADLTAMTVTFVLVNKE